jgi:hypothetical protein
VETPRSSPPPPAVDQGSHNGPADAQSGTGTFTLKNIDPIDYDGQPPKVAHSRLRSFFAFLHARPRNFSRRTLVVIHKEAKADAEA